MPSPNFTLTLDPTVRVIPSEGHCTLQASSPTTATLTLDSYPGLDQAIAQLQQGVQQGDTTREAVIQALNTQGEQGAEVAFAETLRQIEAQGWLNYAVPPLAIAQPLVETAQLNLEIPHWAQVQVGLSRFAYQRVHEGAMVMESPLSKFRVRLLDWRASAILAQLAQPCALITLTPPPNVGAESAFQLLNLLWATNFLVVGEESPDQKLWDFHDRLFQSRHHQDSDEDFELPIATDLSAQDPRLTAEIETSVVIEADDAVIEADDIGTDDDVEDDITAANVTAKADVSAPTTIPPAEESVDQAESSAIAPSPAIIADSPISDTYPTESAGETENPPPAPLPTPSHSPTPSRITPSTAYSGRVYALGAIAYDFGNESQRDTFVQNMAPADPDDARQMIEYLDNHPDEAQLLIWTLNLDNNVLYALDPKGSFANDIYEIFLLMLNGQQEPQNSADFIERISIPGQQTGHTVELLSGEVVPVIDVRDPRGMYGWNVDTLVDGAIASVEDLDTNNEPELRDALTAFFNQVYHDLQNVGQTSRDRALNFAATNTFQAAATFSEAINSGRRLDVIDVEKSPFCRLNSDCWDVSLTFYDPEQKRRSRQVFRFTVDVADAMPVTVGEIKRWSISGQLETVQ